MPSLAILIAIAFLAGGSIFGGLAYTYANDKTKLCYGKIDAANSEAKLVLANETARADKARAEQTIANISLETEHDKNIQHISGDSIALADARMQWAAAQPRSNCTVPKAGNPGPNKADDAGGFYLSASELSAELPALIPKALQSDRIDEDHHFTMQWLNDVTINQPELIQ
jgi:hypothetical protein